MTAHVNGRNLLITPVTIMGPLKALHIHDRFEVSDTATSSSYAPPRLGHGLDWCLSSSSSWLLRNFSFWRQSLIFQRFFRFTSRLLILCCDLKVKKWFLLLTRMVQLSQLRISVELTEFKWFLIEYKSIRLGQVVLDSACSWTDRIKGMVSEGIWCLHLYNLIDCLFLDCKIVVLLFIWNIEWVLGYLRARVLSRLIILIEFKTILIWKLFEWEIYLGTDKKKIL